MPDSYKRTWETRRGGRSVSDESRASYYGLPVIHAPHWNWMIAVYFFLGGISGASYVIASIADLFGGSGARRIAQVGRYLSLAALLPSPILLILDLGRPERFHHMLRILKLRSPMSVGTWGLTIFGGFCGLSALVQAAQDGVFDRAGPLKRLLLTVPRRTSNLIGSFFGFFVGGYTGVLLGVTAVPVWAKNALLLGPLFLSSAMSTAAAAITLALSLMRGDNRDAIKRLDRIEIMTLLAELGLILMARANLGPVLSRPMREGPMGRVFRWGVLGGGMLGPLALKSVSLIAGRHVRALTLLSSLLVLAGGYLLRHLMIATGKASASDPEATHTFARRG